MFIDWYIMWHAWLTLVGFVKYVWRAYPCVQVYQHSKSFKLTSFSYETQADSTKQVRIKAYRDLEL